MTLLERVKRNPRLRAALSAEGKSRFNASLGFLGVDSETGRAAWFHMRPFYRANSRSHGCRIVSIEKIEPELLQQTRGDYFVAFLRRSRSPMTSVVHASAMDGLFWLSLEISDNGETNVIVDGSAGSLPHPLTLHDPVEPLGSVSIRVGTELYACTMPAELVVQSSGDRCHVVLGCDLPRLRVAHHEFVLRKKKRGVIGQTVLKLDIEPQAGIHDRLVLRAGDRRNVALRPLLGEPEQPPPPLVLHVLFDRTTLDAGLHSNAARVTGSVSTTNPSPLPPGDWNARLRRSTAEAVTLAISKRVIELELWPFADVPRDAMSGNRLALSAGGAAWSHIVCHDPEAFRQAMAGDSQCGWRYGLDYVDAVDEVLSAVASRIEERRELQHAVLIIGDSPPPPERVGDGLWNAIVEDRRSNCRRSPLFTKALARLVASRVPVLWAFVMTSSPEAGTEDEGLLQSLHHVQERVARALREIEGLIVSTCYAADLTGTVYRLIERNALRDLRFRPPDRIQVRRGSFHELD